MSSVKEPPVVRFDLTSQAFKQNPFPTLARMRELGPLIRLRFPLIGKVWLATTHDAVNDLLRDHQRFAEEEGNLLRARGRVPHAEDHHQHEQLPHTQHALGVVTECHRIEVSL